MDERRAFGDGLAETLDVSFVFGLYHHARERLRAGVTQNDAAIFARARIALPTMHGNLRQRIERRLRTNFHVHDGLRIVLQAADQAVEGPCMETSEAIFTAVKAIARGLSSRKMMWPDCSPPRTLPLRSISSST